MFSHSRSIVGSVRLGNIATVGVAIGSAMRRRWRERLALGRLDDRLLEDIGLTRNRADAETGKPPWQA